MALLDGAGQLQQPVGERRLSVVDVRDDREVPDPLRWVQPQVQSRHAAAAAVLRRHLGGEEALRLLGSPGESGGIVQWLYDAAGGSPERGGAGHAEPRCGGS